PALLADRVRRRPAGPPAERPRDDRQQRLLQGVGDAGAAPERTAQGQMGAGQLPAGAARLRPPRQLVRRVPADPGTVRGRPAVGSGGARPAALDPTQIGTMAAAYNAAA